ncbi:transcriptional regulator [Sphingomonas oleivorans]|uniref:Transcriptional regulator n=1 Tax=Sphingomonas oleivorans TaxID=1735121 RepID=A0A2T5FWL2_9SPHN|nr:LysR family transcriptional regulator [Sphingomonas oleivorans]PTQ10169.1 transcriptional regulator [Sphingomonas oleivorans]
MQQFDALPDIEALHAFIAVAEEGSFNAAGHRLNRDATIISRRVQALEQGLGVRLIERSTRRVSLTEAGEVYLGHVRPLLHNLLAAGREAGRFTEGEPRGRLRLALPGSFGRMWLMPMLADFLEAYPGVTLDVAFSNRFVDLIGEGFDLAIRLGVLPDSRLVARKLAERKRMICASPAYLQRRGVPASPEELSRYECLIFSGKVNPYVWEFMMPGAKQLVVPVAGPFISDDAEALVPAAVAGRGLLYATDWLVGRELADGRLVRILEDFPVPDEGAIYVVHPSSRHVPNKTRAFAHWISERLSRNLPWQQG